MNRSLLAFVCVVLVRTASASDMPMAVRCGDRVEPAAQPRLFTVAGDATHVLGVLPADESVVSCAGLGTIELRVPARKLARRDFTIARDPDTVWTLPIPRRDITIRLPRDTYTISINGRRRTVVIADKPAIVTVDDLPQLSGIVLDRSTNRPVAGALVSTDVGSDAITDAFGRFAIDADPEQWPSKVSIQAVLYAEKTIPIGVARVSTALPTIFVSHGGTITVEIDEQQMEQVVELELWRADHPYRTASGLRFENVEPGRYVVVAKGKEAFERYGLEVDVAQAEESKVRIAIVPFVLELRTKMEGETLPRAEILMTHATGHWEARLATNDDGEAKAPMWQGGRVKFAVHAEGFSAPYIERRELSDADDAECTLDVPVREITGTVVNARTTDPIPQAAVSLHVDALDGYSLGVRAKADANGRFRFFPVPAGRHRLRVSSSRYTPSEISYLFGESEHDRDVAVRLDPAASVAVTVTNQAGVPIALARVIQFRDRMRMEGRTDSDGKVDVPVPDDGGAAEVYVVPRDGSFAIATLRAQMKEAVIHVPDGVARIEVRAETKEHAPIPNASVPVRYNGRMLPLEVLNALRSENTFLRMPVGQYEFGRDASVKMAAVPGENVVVMTFVQR